MPRIIFNSDTNITWYLSKPKRKQNIEIYDKILVETPIDKSIATLIKNQQNALHNSSSFKMVNRGYLIADKENKILAFDRLKKIILSIIGVSTGNDINNEYPEGKRTSTNSARVTRNRQYVDAVKERDGYTCQACGLKAKIDGFDILQVHHIIRLTAEQSTKLSDLVSLCPTCHFIAHTNDPPLKIKEIKRRLNKHNLHTYS